MLKTSPRINIFLTVSSVQCRERGQIYQLINSSYFQTFDNEQQLKIFFEL